VRFCEGAHSNLGAITSKKGVLWALLDINTDATVLIIKFLLIELKLKNQLLQYFKSVLISVNQCLKNP
ncbi:hypothetical protein C4E22_05110, partial [ANME-1 cluster archaeon AG-394-G06]|nr:hypothetical protein [ANME-1 cluster archaeon AG-394-G06]